VHSSAISELDSKPRHGFVLARKFTEKKDVDLSCFTKSVKFAGYGSKRLARLLLFFRSRMLPEQRLYKSWIRCSPGRKKSTRGATTNSFRKMASDEIAHPSGEQDLLP
jgi:hypothetical protein